MPTVIPATDVDAQSPITDTLMGGANGFKGWIDYLYAQIQGLAGAAPYVWTVNGALDLLGAVPFRRLDGMRQVKVGTFSKVNLTLGKPGGQIGAGETLEVDIRKYKALGLGLSVKTIERLYSAAINSISEIATIATQSITRVTPQVSTQSISYWKATVNVSSIVAYANSEMRVNLASAVDSDYVVGDYVLIAGATSGANNGLFQIKRKSDDGGNTLTLTNAAAVDQASAAGTLRLNALSYNLAAPANTNFNSEYAYFAAHTTGSNNGTFLVYAINQGGNNLIVKQASGATQAGVAGTCDCGRVSFNYASAVPTGFTAAGERCKFASHTSGANNGTFAIRAVNSSGNNLIVYTAAGSVTLQGGVAGTSRSLRRTVDLPTDPTGTISVSDSVVVTGSVVGGFDATYTAKEIKRGGLNNVVIYSDDDTITTAGAGGTLYSAKVKYTFDSDPSAYGITTASDVEFTLCQSTGNNGRYSVLTVNLGGGSNFNVVVVNASNANQVARGGWVDTESKSIFSARPTITYSNRTTELASTLTATFNSQAVVANNDMLGVDILQIPSGQPADLVVEVY